MLRSFSIFSLKFSLDLLIINIVSTKIEMSTAASIGRKSSNRIGIFRKMDFIIRSRKKADIFDAKFT